MARRPDDQSRLRSTPEGSFYIDVDCCFDKYRVNKLGMEQCYAASPVAHTLQWLHCCNPESAGSQAMLDRMCVHARDGQTYLVRVDSMS